MYVGVEVSVLLGGELDSLMWQQAETGLSLVTSSL